MKERKKKKKAVKAKGKKRNKAIWKIWNSDYLTCQILEWVGFILTKLGGWGWIAGGSWWVDGVVTVTGENSWLYGFGWVLRAGWCGAGLCTLAGNKL